MPRRSWYEISRPSARLQVTRLSRWPDGWSTTTTRTRSSSARACKTTARLTVRSARTAAPSDGRHAPVATALEDRVARVQQQVGDLPDGRPGSAEGQRIRRVVTGGDFLTSWRTTRTNDGNGASGILRRMLFRPGESGVWLGECSGGAFGGGITRNGNGSCACPPPTARDTCPLRMGVVFGNLRTSPLYALQEAFHGTRRGPDRTQSWASSRCSSGRSCSW